MCRCRACNAKLSSRELTRKYANYPPESPPEGAYIGLCTACFTQSDIVLAITNPLLPDNDGDGGYLGGEAMASTSSDSSFGDVFNQDEQGILPAVLVDRDYVP